MPSIASRDVGQRADGVDVPRDIGVCGRHDLAAVAEVDLVAVVLRRVVRRGHHDAGRGAEVADRERQHRRRQRPRQHRRRQTDAGHDGRGVPCEHVGLVPRVVADDDRGAAGLEQVRREPGSGADDDHAVHPVRPGTECAAQPGGAELQTGSRTGRPAPSASRDQAVQRARRACRRRGPLPATCRSRAPRRSQPPTRLARAAHPSGRPTRCPAASTSRWSSGSPVIPAARLVTSEMPSTSAPASRAAIASSAVDMPTRSAPRIRSIAISAGVS